MPVESEDEAVGVLANEDGLGFCFLSETITECVLKLSFKSLVFINLVQLLFQQ